MNHIIYNGDLQPDNETPLTPTNRAFLYGDGLFETMRYASGLLFVDDHIKRLLAGAKVIGLEVPSMLSTDYLQDAAHQLSEKNNQPNARIRLSVYRESEGKYGPKGNEASYLITSSALENEKYQLNEKGLTIGLFEAEKKSMGVLANHKTSNALLYVLAAQASLHNGWDDSLIFNTQDRIVEATASNLFLIKGSHLHTPPLSEGPVAGILRKHLFQWTAMEGFGLSSGQVTKDMLLEADEIILTNVITGIRWAERYKTKTYGNKVAKQLVDLINKQIGF